MASFPINLECFSPATTRLTIQKVISIQKEQIVTICNICYIPNLSKNDAKINRENTEKNDERDIRKPMLDRQNIA